MNKKYICTFDYGNTKEKGALFHQEQLLKEFSIKEFSQIVQEFNLNIKNSLIIECSVKSTTRLKSNIPTINVKDLFKNKKFLEMNVDYAETLGMDRLVQAFYHFKTQTSNAAIIDSGTFTTIDFVNDKGFQGGYILPGLEALKKAYQKGDLLKGHNITYTEIESSIPKETDGAMKTGLHFSFIAPIINILTSINTEEIILTGGNTEYIKSVIENHKELKKRKLVIDNQLIHKSLKLVSEKVEEV